MKKAVFLDRKERTNLGARTTCKAFMHILSQSSIEVTTCFDNDFALLTDRNLRYDQMANAFDESTNEAVLAMKKFLMEAHYMILNGEGSLIFMTPDRQELNFHFAMIKWAKMCGCKTFYINSIASPGVTGNINHNKLSEFKEVLQFLDEFVVRDKLSCKFAKLNITNGGGHVVRYIPEALFEFSLSYPEVFSDTRKNATALSGDMFLPFPESSFDLGKIDLSRPYIAISGSSIFNKRMYGVSEDGHIEAYCILIRKLKEQGHNVLIVKTCQEKYLEAIAAKSDCALISPNNNFLLLSWILAHAEVFISGRFHPSIIASLGGTPCIMLTSNSHKSEAFYMYFDDCYKDAKVFPAPLDNKEDIETICKRVTYLVNKPYLRKKLSKKSRVLAKESKEEYIKLFQ